MCLEYFDDSQALLCLALTFAVVAPFLRPHAPSKKGVSYFFMLAMLGRLQCSSHGGGVRSSRKALVPRALMTALSRIGRRPRYRREIAPGLLKVDLLPPRGDSNVLLAMSLLSHFAAAA